MTSFTSVRKTWGEIMTKKHLQWSRRSPLLVLGLMTNILVVRKDTCVRPWPRTSPMKALWLPSLWHHLLVSKKLDQNLTTRNITNEVIDSPNTCIVVEDSVKTLGWDHDQEHHQGSHWSPFTCILVAIWWHIVLVSVKTLYLMIGLTMWSKCEGKQDNLFNVQSWWLLTFQYLIRVHELVIRCT